MADSDADRSAASRDLPDLNFPQYDFSIRSRGAGREIFDAVRKRYVALTPEEWVRQHLVSFLVHERGFPSGLIALEHTFVFEGRTRRADVVAFNRQAQPLVLAECKAASVEVTQAVFDQIASYNAVVGARLLVVSNGLRHYCYEVTADTAGGRFSFVADVPPYNALAATDPSAGDALGQ